MFQETSFGFALRGKVIVVCEILTSDEPHEATEMSHTLHPRNAGRALGTDSTLGADDGSGCLVRRLLGRP